MERLTAKERNWNGTGISNEFLVEEPRLTRHMDKVLTKLANLEDAEEDGRLIILPCKPGDIVYIVGKRHINRNKKKWVIDEIMLDRSGILSAMIQERFGVDIFTTREAAEQRRVELERGEDGSKLLGGK